MTEVGSSVCTRCKEGDRACVFDSKFRFREVRHVDTASQGVRSRTHLVYEDDQLWVPTKEAVGFVLEDGAGAEYGTADFIERSERPEDGVDASAPQPNTGLMEPPRARSMPTEPLQADGAHQAHAADTPVIPNAHISPQVIAQSPALISSHPHSDHLSESGSRLSDAVRPQTRGSTGIEDVTSPASLSELSRRHEGGRRLTWGTGEYGFLVGDSIQASPAQNTIRTPANTATIDLSHREALLVQHFIQKLAPWVSL